MLALLLTVAQTLTVTASPTPEEASPLRGSVLWSVYACTEGPAAVVSGARIEAALSKKVRLLPKPIAAALLAKRTAERWQSRTIRIGGLLLAGSTAITAGGLVAATPRLISSLAMATTVAPEIGKGLRASIPVYDTGQLLDATSSMEIPAGGCAVRHVLAKRTRSTSSVEVTLALLAPRPIKRPNSGAAPTSIPVHFASF
jgi:hypothetical protein